MSWSQVGFHNSAQEIACIDNMGSAEREPPQVKGVHLVPDLQWLDLEFFLTYDGVKALL